MMASVVDEVDSAASWVIEEIARGTPLDSIAIIVPDIDSYAPLILDRLERLELPGGGSGVQAAVPIGLRVSRSPAGLRLAALLGALESSLEAEQTLRLLPWLRSPAERQEGSGRESPSPTPGERADAGDEATSENAPAFHPPLTPSRAAEIIFGAGIVGGREARGDEWSRHLGMRMDALGRALSELGPGPDEPDKRRVMRDRQRTQAEIAHIERLRPAVAALEVIAARVRSGATLAVLWRDVAAFVRDWLKLPPFPPNLPAIFHKFITPLLDHPAASSLGGVPAIRFLAERLDARRLPVGTTGAAAVCVTTAAGAAGRIFTAVRVLGLAEGVVPRSPHDDPIVPDEIRQKLESRLGEGRNGSRVIALVEDQVLEDLQAFDRVVIGTRSRLVLTTPRQWLDRSEREMSGVLLEVAMALRPVGEVPTLAELRTHLLGPAGAGGGSTGAGGTSMGAGGTSAGPGGGSTAQAAAAVFPPAALAFVRSRARMDGSMAVPAGWVGEAGAALNQVRILRLEDEQSDPERLGVADGLLDRALPAAVIPGITPVRPISASGLQSLLSCPYQFFQERILARAEPPERPSMDVIDPRSFGELLHTIAEAFFREHGPSFCRGEEELEAWLARMHRTCERQLAAFLDR
jgi:hypothetical protein